MEFLSILEGARKFPRATEFAAFIAKAELQTTEALLYFLVTDSSGKREYFRDLFDRLDWVPNAEEMKKEAEEHINFYNEEKIPIIGKIINNGSVEGGDCLWINNKTLLVGESDRTNKSGINQLSGILNKHNILLIPIKLPKYDNEKSCFHLMSLISMLDDDLAIGCMSLLPLDLINLLNKNNIKVIEIPEDEYFDSKTLAVNILALSPRNLVAMKGYPKTIDLLYKYGCQINLFSGSELCIKAEGGPTCLTRPIWRE